MLVFQLCLRFVLECFVCVYFLRALHLNRYSLSTAAQDIFLLLPWLYSTYKGLFNLRHKVRLFKDNSQTLRGEMHQNINAVIILNVSSQYTALIDSYVIYLPVIPLATEGKAVPALPDFGDTYHVKGETYEKWQIKLLSSLQCSERSHFILQEWFRCPMLKSRSHLRLGLT